MKKKEIIIVVIAVLVIAGYFLINIFVGNKNSDVYITLNNPVMKSLDDKTELERYYINSQDDIDTLEKYIDKIEPMKQPINLKILSEIQIHFHENIVISIQKEFSHYCWYYNKESGESYLAFTPDGLYDWVINKMK